MNKNLVNLILFVLVSCLSITLLVAVFFGWNYFQLSQEIQLLIEDNQKLQNKQLTHEEATSLINNANQDREWEMVVHQPEYSHTLIFKSTGTGQVVDYMDSINPSTEEKVNDGRVNPYWDLVKTIEAQPIDSIVFASSVGVDYAIAKVIQGNLETIYKIEAPRETGAQTIKAVSIQPYGKMSYLCRRKILDYFPESKQILIDQGCGDVAANGEIGLLSDSNQFTPLETYESGLSMDELKRTFLGYINGRLFFADVQSNMSNYPDSYIITDVYSVDPLTKNKTYLAQNLAGLSLNPFLDSTQDYANTATQLIFQSTENQQFYRINVESGEIEKIEQPVTPRESTTP